MSNPYRMPVPAWDHNDRIRPCVEISRGIDGVVRILFQDDKGVTGAILSVQEAEARWIIEALEHQFPILVDR